MIFWVECKLAIYSQIHYFLIKNIILSDTIRVWIVEYISGRRQWFSGRMLDLRSRCRWFNRHKELRFVLEQHSLSMA